jgi:cytochrome c peroxidase
MILVDRPLDFTMPSNFPTLVYNVELNPPTEKGFRLGKNYFMKEGCLLMELYRVDFVIFKKMLYTSRTYLESWNDNLVGDRNTPSIQNLAFQTTFMYDGAQIIWIYCQLFR